jgi:hypothetical protein
MSTNEFIRPGRREPLPSGPSGGLPPASGGGGASGGAARPPGLPALRLVGGGRPDTAGPAANPQVIGQPIGSPSDPRWIVAMRTAQAMEGSILRPEKRELLIMLGKRLGLSPFDANLIIAMVQDQARRGYAPEYCPTAAEPQLRMVPLPRGGLTRATGRPSRALLVAGVLAIILAVELVLAFWLLG